MVRGFVAAALAVALASTAAPASAELASWDQDRVTKYAEELVEAADDLEISLKKIGIQNLANANAIYQVQDTVDMLHTATRGLAGALSNGKGREETMPRFKRVDSLRRDAELEGRRADIPEQVFEKVFAVGGALQRLRPYYIDEEEEKAKAAE
ncbi:MAG: hypothetical protein ABFS41_05440 [Myxococcota bacterium]